MKSHCHTVEIRIKNHRGEEVFSGNAPPNRPEPASQIELEIQNYEDFRRLLDLLGFLKNQKDHHKQPWWKTNPKFAGTFLGKVMHSALLTKRTWRRDNV